MTCRCEESSVYPGCCDYCIGKEYPTYSWLKGLAVLAMIFAAFYFAMQRPSPGSSV